MVLKFRRHNLYVFYRIFEHNASLELVLGYNSSILIPTSTKQSSKISNCLLIIIALSHKFITSKMVEFFSAFLLQSSDDVDINARRFILYLGPSLTSDSYCTATVHLCSMVQMQMKSTLHWEHYIERLNASIYAPLLRKFAISYFHFGSHQDILYKFQVGILNNCLFHSQKYWPYSKTARPILTYE